MIKLELIKDYEEKLPSIVSVFGSRNGKNLILLFEVCLNQSEPKFIEIESDVCVTSNGYILTKSD